MYEEPIFLEPFFQDRIWGGQKLRTFFGYDIPSDKTGEAWVISAHKNGPSTIANGLLKGKNLLEAWNDNPLLFGKEQGSGEFPLLVKILDANESLSVQVHPSTDYAREMEDMPYGKAECWYVLDCEPDSRIILGHRAESREDFKERVDAEQWDELLLPLAVKKGDFFYIPSGTVHAIGKGIMVVEIQQSSDITYRVYDYNRVTAEGKARELHIQSAIDVINFPHHNVLPPKIAVYDGDLASMQLIKESYFTVYHWEINGEVKTPLKRDYLLISVIAGAGEISVNGQSFLLEKGSHFILPSTVETYGISGKLELLVTHE
ncbi:mannose-6-phosphate isomerase, class I [Planococcus sp. 4-30]|uniref:mannose-6-phosphate isomerase, class I n=1 Tax=Planococcus sp. 4-30 TaxID=2874583 RepID=UPI001CC199E3|nr:mannose-6-phosphate isomerase, class I [Planococcus sp. 4-30]